MSSAELDAVVAGQTVPRLFAATVADRPDAVALRWKDGEGWGEWTWRDYADRACRVAGGLAALGVGRGDRVVLMMRNRPEFHVADLAALLLGATPISIYNSSAPEQVQYLAGHCQARIAIVEDDDYLERVTERSRRAAGARRRRRPRRRATRGVHRFADLLGRRPVDLADGRRPSQIRPTSATVIYTSGTTGPPKGVMIDHCERLLDGGEPAARVRRSRPDGLRGSCRTSRWRTSPSG